MTESIILKNFSFLTVSNIIEKGITFIITIVLARHLGAEGYGVYALILSFVGLFGNLFDGGVNFFLMREVAKGIIDKKVLLGTASSAKVVIGVIILISINLLVVLLKYPSTASIGMLVYSISMLIFSFSNIFRSVFIGLERGGLEALFIIIARVVLLAGVVFFIVLNIKLPMIMAVHIISNLTVLILGWAICKKKFFTPKWNWNIFSIKKLLKKSFPFAIGAIMGELYFNIDTVMISKMLNLTVVGYYNAAYKLSFSGVLLANTLTLAFFPHISKKWSEGKNISSLFSKLFKTILVSSLFFSLIAYLFSHNIIIFIFGHNFLKSIPLFKLLVWALPPLSLMHLTIRTLEGIGDQIIVAKTMSVSVLLNIVLNYILISKFGAIGASIATILTSVFIVFIQMIIINRRI